MNVRIDRMDRNILAELQRDASQSLDDIARSVGSSKTAAEGYLEEIKVELDNSYESFTETLKAEYMFRDLKLREKVEDFYRCEGIGTQDQTKRVYVDVAVFQLKGSDKQYVCSSVSSILNGCVEGPYFEEALVNAKLV